ncbi:MAG: bifunctional phosphopantothenoylcysteine decarboxylase/phosphopantothenate--cysteine ligase CoaBC [Halieaceae bacterium]|nr:bifunctional phosphopantothenoylcysteine decarboxylase/phosphopantothenate--cysteine ligase CoaBC [Halieaceae bacterium]
MSNLSNKNVLLGISGSIAAYKSAELIRRLQDSGATVRVVMTKSATEFITPLTMQALSQNPVHTELLDEVSESAMGHIELARWADFLIVAPASANLIAELTHGRSDNLLTAICLATSSDILLAPAMNQRMWLNPATQENVAILKSRGYYISTPEDGDQACGETGPGRMAEPIQIISLTNTLFQSDLLTGTNILITAGPTREPLDPVRYLTNHSSGKMGFALAEAACSAGAKVTLVAGPVNLQTPRYVVRYEVETAQDMLETCLEHAPSADIFIGCAAVSDYRPKYRNSEKIKKTDELLKLELIRNPDVVSHIAGKFERMFCLGFAAETHHVLENARQKILTKKLDLLVANDVSNPEIGFDSDLNEVSLIWHKGEEKLQQASKTVIAKQIINRLAALYKDSQN